MSNICKLLDMATAVLLSMQLTESWRRSPDGFIRRSIGAIKQSPLLRAWHSSFCLTLEFDLSKLLSRYTTSAYQSNHPEKGLLATDCVYPT